MPKFGRNRDLEARERILRATARLIGERGSRQVTIADITEAAAVSRQTIYRWWPNKAAVTIDALALHFEEATPPDATGRTHDDLLAQMQFVSSVFDSPVGEVLRALVAEAQDDEVTAKLLNDGFVQGRRDRARTLVEAGIASGELRNDLEVEVAIDSIYGPLWLRLVLRRDAITSEATEQLFTHVWRSLRADSPVD